MVNHCVDTIEIGCLAPCCLREFAPKAAQSQLVSELDLGKRPSLGYLCVCVSMPLRSHFGSRSAFESRDAQGGRSSRKTPSRAVGARPLPTTGLMARPFWCSAALPLVAALRSRVAAFRSRAPAVSLRGPGAAAATLPVDLIWQVLDLVPGPGLAVWWSALDGDVYSAWRGPGEHQPLRWLSIPSDGFVRLWPRGDGIAIVGYRAAMRRSATFGRTALCRCGSRAQHSTT